MKVEELVGKVVVRNKSVRVQETGFSILGSSSHEDATFTTRPIKIEGIKNDIVFYREQPLENLKILAPRYQDDAWAQIPDELLGEFWKE